MNDIVLIDGDLDLVQVIDDDLDLELTDSGEFSEFTAMRDVVYPIYDGPVEITPSGDEQILETTQKTTMSDIVIKPIPNNYGLISWDGSTITVS